MIFLAAGNVIAYLVILAIGIGLSIAASYLLQPKDKTGFGDQPSTNVDRGSYLPFVYGRHRVGPIFAWAGLRKYYKDDSGGGKGFGGRTSFQGVYTECAMHLLCIGPVKTLWGITINSKTIYYGPLHAADHPSGSFIPTSTEGGFKIYWGEPTQPANTTLPGAGALSGALKFDATSQWPGICYIEWVDKRLGPVPNWDIMEYEVETEIQTPLILTASAAFIPAVQVLFGTQFYLYRGSSNGSFGGFRAYKITVLIDRATFPPELFYDMVSVPFTLVRITGLFGATGITDGDYQVLSAQYGGIDGMNITIKTNIAMPTVIPTINYSPPSSSPGRFEPYRSTNDGGLNGAHVMAQMLFKPFPHGLALDTAEFDMDSLEDVGLELEARSTRSNFVISDGTTAEEALSALMQDLGVALPWNPNTGLFEFVLIRKPLTGNTVVIPDDAVQAPLPEREVVLAQKAVDKIVFEYFDRGYNFKTSTVVIDEDGQATEEDSRQRTSKTRIPTATDRVTAVQIAERRSQEELAGGAKYTLFLGRSGKALTPGRTITVTDLPAVLRVVEVESNVNTGRTRIAAVADFYGALETTYDAPPVDGVVPAIPPALSPASMIFEMPDHLLQGNSGGGIIVLFARGNVNVNGANIYVSNDGTTYRLLGIQTTLHDCLELVADNDDLPLTETSEQYIPVGLNIPDTPRTWSYVGAGTSLGAGLEDLTANEAAWLAGRQMLVTERGEIMFLRSLGNLGGGLYYLDGVVRARLDTLRQNYVAGDRAYAVLGGGYTLFRDPSFLPGSVIYIKVQPTGGEEVDLSDITPNTLTLRGNNILPMRPSALRANKGTNTYLTGTLVRLDWAFRVPVPVGTGAGMFPAGESKPALTAPVGTFELTIKDTSNVVKRTVSTTDPAYNYLAADLSSDFGGYPTEFVVEVYNAVGPYVSETLVLHVFKRT